MQIQRNTGIGWRGRRPIGKLHMDRSVKIQEEEEEEEEEEERRSFRQECCLSPILFNLYSENSKHYIAFHEELNSEDLP
jgi:hypothetical protein